jgi:hypothetical protein
MNACNKLILNVLYCFKISKPNIIWWGFELTLQNKFQFFTGYQPVELSFGLVAGSQNRTIISIIPQPKAFL